jgi:hypothetical protein
MAVEPIGLFVQFEPRIFPRSFKRPLTSAEITKTRYAINDRENCIFFIFNNLIHWEYPAQQLVGVRTACAALGLY